MPFDIGHKPFEQHGPAKCKAQTRMSSLRNVILSALNTYDPGGLLAMGAPADEYEYMASEITNEVFAAEDFHDIWEAVSGIWALRFSGERPDRLKDVAREIWASHQFSQLN